MNYLNKEEMNPIGIKKFFNEAIANKEAVEIFRRYLFCVWSNNSYCLIRVCRDRVCPKVCVNL